LSRNLGTVTSWNPLGHSRLVMGLLYLYLYIRNMNIVSLLFIFSLGRTRICCVIENTAVIMVPQNGGHKGGSM
jgi:hypothetical protein